MNDAAAKPEPAGTPGEDRTERARGQTPRARLPMERDESADAQRHAEHTGKAVGRQAHEDLRRGLSDTSRGDEADATYNDKVVPGAPRSGSR